MYMGVRGAGLFFLHLCFLYVYFLCVAPMWLVKIPTIILGVAYSSHIKDSYNTVMKCLAIGNRPHYKAVITKNNEIPYNQKLKGL